MEARWRSITKSLTWRVAALLITTATAWAVTGRADVAATVGAIDSAIKLAAYYAHERAWLRVRRGRLELPEYEI